MESDNVDPELNKIRENKIKALIEEQQRSQISSTPKPINLKKGTFDKFIEDHPIVFVDFWADWCNPCKQVEPILEELAEEFEGEVWIGKVNVDKNRELAMRYGATSIPTFWAFINGKPIQRYVGLLPKQVFGKIFEQMVQASKK